MDHGTSNSYPLPGAEDAYLLTRGFPRGGRDLGATARFCLDRAIDATITGAVSERPGMFRGTGGTVGNGMGETVCLCFVGVCVVGVRLGDTVGVRIGAAVIF
jgi:hypothetical protein